jgi:hypothetical protein
MPQGPDERRGDQGYQLLAGRRRDFEASIDFRLPLHKWLGRLNRTSVRREPRDASKLSIWR